MSTADDNSGMRRNVVVLSSDSDEDAPIVAAPGKKGKKPSRPVVISSDDDEEEGDFDCVAIAAAEAEGRDQLAASLGALSVSGGAQDEKEKNDNKKKESEAAPSAPPPPPLPPVAFGEILLDGAIASQLYPHQKEGVAWMSSLASGVAPPRGAGATAPLANSSSSSSSPPPRRFHGGILADEMGLGKTRQVAAFLRGALDSGVARRALVVAPKSLLRVWAEELSAVGVAAREFGPGSAADRAAALAAAGPPWGSGVLLTTYGMLLHNGDELKRGSAAAKGKKQQQPEQGRGQGRDEAAAAVGNDGSSWDAVVFDEGHCLKNPKTKIAELARSLDSKMKILLSGTPVSFPLAFFFKKTRAKRKTRNEKKKKLPHFFFPKKKKKKRRSKTTSTSCSPSSTSSPRGSWRRTPRGSSRSSRAGSSPAPAAPPARARRPRRPARRRRCGRGWRPASCAGRRPRCWGLLLRPPLMPLRRLLLLLLLELEPPELLELPLLLLLLPLRRRPPPPSGGRPTSSSGSA